MKKLSLLICLVLYGGIQLKAQYPWTGILPAGTGIDWSTAGVPGGIPSPAWTQSGSTISSTGSDQSSQIQTALNSCGTNHFIQLAAGTFRINTAVNPPSHCALRGMGADQTKLNTFGSGGAPINLGSGGVALSSTNITSGAAAASTSVVVSNGSLFSGKNYMVVTETNDNVTVDIRGGEGNCNWCDGGWTSDGHLASGQIVSVVSVVGNTVTFSPGLYRAYTNTPLAVPFSMSVEYAGVEDLQIIDNNTGYAQNVNMSRCAYCWVKGVGFNYTKGDYVDVSWGFHDEIRDSYMSNGYTHQPGQADQDISLLLKTSASLVENNIID